MKEIVMKMVRYTALESIILLSPPCMRIQKYNVKGMNAASIVFENVLPINTQGNHEIV
jgi:hypothetical protein